MSRNLNQPSTERPASGGLIRRPGFSAALWTLGCFGAGCMALAFIFANCAPAGGPKLGETNPVIVKIAEMNEHRKGPISELEWNGLGFWHRISDQPPTYLPRSFGRDRPRDHQSGTWMVDARDGKRLFVPKGGIDGISEAVLMADARKATQWKPRP